MRGPSLALRWGDRPPLVMRRIALHCGALRCQMYERMSKLKSPHGVTVDKCIQPSVDNKGDIIGLVAGDPECYDVRIHYTHWPAHPIHGLTQIHTKPMFCR